MKRLTQYNEELEEIDFLIDNVAERGAYTIIDLAKYRGINSDFDDFLLKIAQKLKKYEDLEEQGLLIKLPCKVGDTLYLTNPQDGITEVVVKEFVYRTYPIHRLEIYFENTKGFETCLFNGTLNEGVFLTQAEAEKALRKNK